MSRGWPGRSRYGGGLRHLQKVGLSLKDDGAAGTCPGNASPRSEAWRRARVASSEQRLRGLLRPRPRFSRLPFGEPCLPLGSPEALPAASAEVSPGPASLLTPRASRVRRESLVFRRFWRPAIRLLLVAGRGRGGSWGPRDGAPSARRPGGRHRSALEPSCWDFTRLGQVCWCFLGFVLREVVEGSR